VWPRHWTSLDSSTWVSHIEAVCYVYALSHTVCAAVWVCDSVGWRDLVMVPMGCSVWTYLVHCSSTPASRGGHELTSFPGVPPPVFDRLQYANTEGEGLGDLVMCGYVR